MKILLKATLYSLICIQAISANATPPTGSVTGKVSDDQGPIIGATVLLKGSQQGAVADEQGVFLLEDLPIGKQTLVFSSVGYRSKQVNVEVLEGKTVTLNQQLREDAFGLEEMVVTGTMQPTYVAESPVKVEVVSIGALEKSISPTNFVEAIKMVNGVQEVTACGVCFTNSISINGLPGPYTAILLDGAPVYGNLAAVYGLNGLPNTIIDRFEIIKGPNSTLYGSEAVAGVINIITKDPKEQPTVALDLMATSHAETFGNISISPKVGRFNTMTGINYAHVNHFEDDNGDGFSDIAGLDRLSIFSKWDMERKSGKKFTLSGKLYYEDRRNGVRKYLENRAYKDLRGDEEIYGESIYTKRAELFGTYEFDFRENIRIDYSFSYHDQDSYYGADHYVAEQKIGFANMVWTKQAGRHSLLGGLTLRYNDYDDNTVATQFEDGRNNPSQQFIPGIFIQDEWKLTDRFTTMAGGRLDHYEAHGLVFSPRLNMKYKVGEWTTLRSNFGTGFRMVNLFTEDHAFVSGNRSIEIVEDLKPETSYNLSFNFNHVYLLGGSEGMVDIDAYYTYFTNAIFPNYDDPTKIIYGNIDGHAVTKGIGLNINQQFGRRLTANIGMNLQEVTETVTDDRGKQETSAIPFAAGWSGVSTINYDIPKRGWSFAYTVNATGPMALPEVYDLDPSGQPLSEPRPTTSAAFAIHNLQINKEVPKWNTRFYMGVQNIFNLQQEWSPLTGFNDPNSPTGFSEFFDTSYAYAPLHGREIYFGFRLQLK